MSSAEFAATYLSLANAFLLFLVVVIVIAYADARRSRLQISLRSEHKIGQVLNHIANITTARTSLSTSNMESFVRGELEPVIVAKTSRFLQTLINEARVIFDEFTGHACSISIKLFVPGDDGTPRIVTFIRDDRSEPVRAGIYGSEKSYPYTDHSPFVDILNQSVGVEYYLENNLRQAEINKTYSNGNRDWSKFYNATLVVPISSPGSVPGENLVGFLCIDSKTARFDNVVCPNIARIVASNTFLAIYELSALDERGPNTGEAPQDQVGVG